MFDVDAVRSRAASEDVLERRHLLRRRLRRDIEMHDLISDPALVAGIVECHDLVGDDFGDIGAIVVVARPGSRIDLAAHDHHRV